MQDSGQDHQPDPGNVFAAIPELLLVDGQRLWGEASGNSKCRDVKGLEPARKVVERYHGFMIHRLCWKDGGTTCLGLTPLVLSIDGMACAIQAI
jgi:hypothetical protein